MIAHGMHVWTHAIRSGSRLRSVEYADAHGDWLLDALRMEDDRLVHEIQFEHADLTIQSDTLIYQWLLFEGEHSLEDI